MNLSDKIDYLNDNKSFVVLVDKMMQDTALKTVNAARQSYNKEKTNFDEKDKKLADFLWGSGHSSPFRHSFYTLHIKMPVFVARQLMKYSVGSNFRTFEIGGKEVSAEVFEHYYSTDSGCSWNEVSARYTKLSEDFYIPKELRSNPPHGNKQTTGEYVNPLPEDSLNRLRKFEILQQYSQHCEKSMQLYNLFTENGVGRELARAILPPAFYTEVTWTLSLQALIHFLSQRLEKSAQYEIKCLAEGIYLILKEDLDRLGLTRDKIVV